MKAINGQRAMVEMLENRQLMSMTTIVITQPAPPVAPPLYTFGLSSPTFSGTVTQVTMLSSVATSGLTAVIHWGDGTKSVGTLVMASIQGSSVTYNVMGSHTYGTAQGSIPVRVVVWRDINTAGQAVVGVTYGVAQYNPGGLSTQESGVVVNLLFAGMLGRYNLPASLSGEFANINWGDGQTSAGILQADPHGGTDVYGQHTYTSVGVFEVSVGAYVSPPGSNVVAPLANFETTINSFNFIVPDQGFPTVKVFNGAIKISDSTLSSVLE